MEDFTKESSEEFLKEPVAEFLLKFIEGFPKHFLKSFLQESLDFFSEGNLGEISEQIQGVNLDAVYTRILIIPLDESIFGRFFKKDRCCCWSTLQTTNRRSVCTGC